MRILECEQCTQEWFKARAGMPTSSEFNKIITTKGKPSEQRQKYMYRLAGERLGGIIEEGYQSLSMIRGKEKEEEAKAFYEFTRESIQAVGFCISDCGKFGASSDGLLNDKGVFELKCPEIHTHVGYLINGEEIPTEYFCQTQGELLVTGREYVEFMSYYPGLPPLIVREEPNEVFQKLLKRELELFTEELNELVKKIKNQKENV